MIWTPTKYQAGYMAGAVFIIGSLWSVRDGAFALADSGPMPFAGKSTVEMVAQATKELTAAVEKLTQNVQRLEKRSALNDLKEQMDQKRDIQLRLEDTPDDTFLRRLLFQTETRIAELTAEVQGSPVPRPVLRPASP